MSEEIKKQYANGIVNADEVIKSLIDKFKTDKTSVDIQQLQLIAEYLLYKVDKLQKDNYKLDRENQHFFDRIQDLQKENEELSQSNFSFLEINQKLIEEKPVIKELEEKELNLLDTINNYLIKILDVKNLLLDFIPQTMHEVELKTKILNIIRGDNND